jgi:hypothetical protein
MPKLHAPPKQVVQLTAAWALFSLLGRTWRITHSGDAALNPRLSSVKGVIYCCWHSRILQVAYAFRGCGITTVVSASRDGDKAVALAGRWGHTFIRGSSSKQGIQALRQCVDVLESGGRVTLIPDGPRGPREVAKPGVAQLALLSGAPIVPVRATSSRAWRFSSWDRFALPKPFAKVDYCFCPAIVRDPSMSKDDAVASMTTLVQKALEP